MIYRICHVSSGMGYEGDIDFFFLIYFLLGQGIYRSKYNISKGKTNIVLH